MEQQTDYSTKPRGMNNGFSGQEFDYKPEDEINLSELAVSVYNVLKKYIKLITVFGFLGLVSGIMFWYLTPSVYQGSFTALSRKIPVKQLETIIDQLETALKEQNTVVVAESLALSVEQANSISEITLIETDDEEAGRFFTVEIKGTDKMVLKEMDQNVIHFLNENNYLARQNKLEKQKVLDNINDLNIEISKLEALQKELNGLLTGSSAGLGSSKTNLYFSELSDISRQILVMKSNVAELNFELEKFDEVQLIQGVFGVNEPGKLTALKTVFIFTFAAFLLAMFIIFIKESYRYLEDRARLMVK